MADSMALAALSTKLTDTLAAVELQRATLEEVIVRLADQAKHLAAVSGVLTGATHAQGAVLQELHTLLDGNGGAAAALQPAAAAVAQASQMLNTAAAASTTTPKAPPPTAQTAPPTQQAAGGFGASFEASFDDAPAPPPQKKPPPPPPPKPQPATAAAAPTATRPSPAKPPSSSSSQFGGPRVSQRAVPIVEPDMDDEEGVQYVSNLRIQGSAVVGGTLTAVAEFVGQPSVQWYRSKGTEKPAEIAGAASLAYTLTADDIGCTVRVECVGPYGGDPVSAAIKEVAPDPSFLGELQKLHAKKGGEREIAVRSVPGDEPRVLLLAKDKVKLRKKKHTEWKHDYSAGLAVHLSAYDEQGFTIQLEASGANNVDLAAESAAERNLIAFLLRQLAPGAKFTAAPAGGPSRQGADDGVSEATGSGDEGGFMDHMKRGMKGEGEGEEEDEGMGEEEVFKPAVEFKIRAANEVAALPSAEKLRSISIGFAAPPPPGGASRRRGVSMAATATEAKAAAPSPRHASAPQAADAVAEVRKARELHEAAEAAKATAAASTEAAKPAAAAKPQAEMLRKVGGPSLDSQLESGEGDEADEAEPPAASTPSQPPSNGTAASAAALFNLLCVESINATFDGTTLRAGSFQAQGELRVLQLGKNEAPHGFKLALDKAGNIKEPQPNPKLMRKLEGGAANAFEVRVPARPAAEAAKPLALMRYGSKADYAPIPLKVTPRWAHIDGCDRLELRVAAHPALKGGLKDVRIVVTMGEDVTACRSTPAGDWQQGTRTLTWKIAQVAAGAAPLPFRADFATGGASKEGRTGKPITAHFSADTCNLTGIQPRPASGAPVGKILLKMVSGKYVINCS